MNGRFVSLFFCVVVAIALLPSCTANKKLTERAVYFKNISDSALALSAPEYEPILQKGDILYIGVITANEKSSRIFNSPNFYAGSEVAPSASSSGNPTQGYLIDEQGMITFPVVGRLKAAGLTKAVLTDTISNRVRQYIDSAIISIRLLNYRVTVLGEVVRPGTYSIPSERVSILDAIGLAGDLTIYGRRDKIRVIRTLNGVRETALLNINEGNVFASPYFYLRQNDIVYVELNERKVPNTDLATVRSLGVVLSLISVVSVIISTINVLK